MNNEDLEKLLRKVVQEAVKPLDEKIDRLDKNLSKKIDTSQEETVESTKRVYG